MNFPNGWLSGKQASYLAQLVRDVVGVEGGFLEVGSWHGRSSVVIGLEVKKLNSCLYCVDIWSKKMVGEEEKKRKKTIKAYRDMPDVAAIYFKGDSFLIFIENIKVNGLGDTIIPVVGLSSTVRATWKIPLRFIFIDGNHEYEYVRDDSLWRQFLTIGGIIAFHDYRRGSEVKKAVNEEMDNDSNFEMIGGIHNIKVFRRLK